MIAIKICLCTILLMCCLISSSNGQAMLTPPLTNPDFPNMCYDPKTQIAYAMGFTFRPKGSCYLVQCTQDLRIYTVGCGLAAFDKEYCQEIDNYLSKPYPECCQRFTCTYPKNE